MRKVVVLGNGPSLKGFDFSSLGHIDSIGMNAAYRFWDEIDWYPTHYVCLDDQLIETHAAEIYRLVTTGLVKTAFLVEKILDFHPDLIDHENVVYLESFVRSKYRTSCRSNLSFFKSRSFLDSDSSKITTGSYAVRYAAHLEYDAITLLGIDLKYEEVLPEAIKVKDIALKMASTPTENPNYFFDHYQREGDKFNIPNPSIHGVNLHVRSFEVLAYDIFRHGWQSIVFNSTEASRLFSSKIIGYMEIEKFFSFTRFDTEAINIKAGALNWKPSIFQKIKFYSDLFIHHCRCSIANVNPESRER